MYNAIISETELRPGQVIRQLRKETNTSVRELAQRSGTSTSGINRWENGKRTPNFDVFMRLMAAMNADVVIVRRTRRDIAEGAPASEEGNNAE